MKIEKEQPSKVESCGLAFLKAGKEGLNTIDAVNAGYGYFSSCLNTDVSNLGKIFGIELARHNEAITFSRGHTARFKRYYLANQDEALKTVELVNYFRKKRKAKELTEVEKQYYLSQFSE